MLRRVLRDVIGENVEAVWRSEADERGVVQVTLSPRDPESRRVVGLTASGTGWFEICFIDLGFEATLCEDEDEEYMESILRHLALVADAYLSGAGRVEQVQGFFRRGPVLKITVNGLELAVGRHWASVQYPEVD